eukprot:SAG11_NODE_867_length_6831_cov_5.720737_5_plen_179_part_00
MWAAWVVQCVAKCVLPRARLRQLRATERKRVRDQHEHLACTKIQVSRWARGSHGRSERSSLCCVVSLFTATSVDIGTAQTMWRGFLERRKIAWLRSRLADADGRPHPATEAAVEARLAVDADHGLVHMAAAAGMSRPWAEAWSTPPPTWQDTVPKRVRAHAHAAARARAEQAGKGWRC